MPRIKIKKDTNCTWLPVNDAARAFLKLRKVKHFWKKDLELMHVLGFEFEVIS